MCCLSVCTLNFRFDMFGGDIQGSFDRETLLQAAIVSILAAIITLVLYWAWFGKR